MPTNYTLKLAIMKNPWSAKRIAESINMTPTRLSKIVGGYTIPTKTEKTQIATALGYTEMSLFEEKTSGVQQTSHEEDASGTQEV